jgi:hypothetical protein
VFIEDEYGEYNVYTLKEANGKWETIEIPLRFASDSFNYKLYGRLNAGGIFIDNIRLLKEETTTSTRLPKEEMTNSHNSFFSISGVERKNMRKGINIVRKPDGSTVKIFVK